MLLKRGILPVMAILTSLHSYGANFTKQGTASATISDGLSFSSHTQPSGGTFLAPTSFELFGGKKLLTVKPDNTYQTEGSSFGESPVQFITPPNIGQFTINGNAGASVSIILEHQPKLYGTSTNIDLDLKLYNNTQSVGNAVTIGGSTDKRITFNTTMNGDGTKSLIITPTLTIPQGVSYGNYSGTYTITAVYI